MSVRRKKGFTLIELVAVLVIMAILALIVTPLVLNIIRKARASADKRSIDAYGRSVKLAIATHLLDTGSFPTDLKSLNIEYTGKEVNCNIIQMKENGGIYLSECTVGGKLIKDDTTEDGYYHYGTRDITNKEYVDMYGLALKKASLKYFNINGRPVEDYTTLTVEYTGKKVLCEVTVNYDGTIYMTKCKVNRVDVTDDTEDGYYHYGKMALRSYSIGDQVTYNNINYYVIKDSSTSELTVTLLKATPLTTEEVNTYGGVGTSYNHVNMYVTNDTTASYYRTAYDQNGYGVMAYYSSATCGYGVGNGCTIKYTQSEVKYVVDAWASAKASAATEVRLITFKELTEDLGFEVQQLNPSTRRYKYTEKTPNAMYDSSYSYWTMSQYLSSTSYVWQINNNGQLWNTSVRDIGYGGAVRPVITLSKTNISSLVIMS